MKPIEFLDPTFKTKLEKGICTTCSTDIGNFRDDLSYKEYQISGMCQECQDGVFDCAEVPF